MMINAQDLYEDLGSIEEHVRANNHDAAFNLIEALRDQCVSEGAKDEEA